MSVHRDIGPDGALLIAVQDDTGRVVAEGRIMRPSGGNRAWISWWPAGDPHALSPERAADWVEALLALIEAASRMR